MPEPDFSKVFDVSKPKATPTSRPVIVGHRPIMADPMMARPSKPAGPSTPVTEAPSELVPHQAKTIPVTTEVSEEIKKAAETAPGVEPASQPAAPAQPEPPAPAEEPHSQPPSSAEPKTAELAKVPLTPAPAAAAPLPVAPTMPTVLPHLNSLPVSHESVTSARRLKALIFWLAILAFLGLVAAYLAIDAGLVSIGIKLPFHVFSQG